MFSLESEIFSISKQFDAQGRYQQYSFEIIRNPIRAVKTYPLGILTKQLLELYALRGWTMPGAEISETMEKAECIVLLKKGEMLQGFFAARRYGPPGMEIFYYLERLIVAPYVPLHTLVPLAALLVFNLPGFGREKLTICAISRLKAVLTLVKLFGPDFYCSTRDYLVQSERAHRVRAILAVLSEKRQLGVSAGGVLKDIFNPGFTHDGDKRIITGTTALDTYDGVFLMNTIPAGREGIFNALYGSALLDKSRFIYSVVEKLDHEGLFEKQSRSRA